MNRVLVFSCLSLFLLLSSCIAKKYNVITSCDYDKAKDVTNYIVLPYGSANIPGKWKRTKYNSVSRQQFFINEDLIELAIAFVPNNNFEFNKDGKLKGIAFAKAYYEWDTNYFLKTYGYKSKKIEGNTENGYMLYKVFGEKNSLVVDTYFLVAEKNGAVSNYSITISDKWSEQEKLSFLKKLYSGI